MTVSEFQEKFLSKIAHYKHGGHSLLLRYILTYTYHTLLIYIHLFVYRGVYCYQIEAWLNYFPLVTECTSAHSNKGAVLISTLEELNCGSLNARDGKKKVLLLLLEYPMILYMYICICIYVCIYIDSR